LLYVSAVLECDLLVGVAGAWRMGCEEDERLLFPSFAFPAESFAEAATPGSGQSQLVRPSCVATSSERFIDLPEPERGLIKDYWELTRSSTNIMCM
jgi:hypothetical protein